MQFKSKPVSQQNATLSFVTKKLSNKTQIKDFDVDQKPFIVMWSSMAVLCNQEIQLSRRKLVAIAYVKKYQNKNNLSKV